MTQWQLQEPGLATDTWHQCKSPSNGPEMLHLGLGVL